MDVNTLVEAEDRREEMGEQISFTRENELKRKQHKEEEE